MPLEPSKSDAPQTPSAAPTDLNALYGDLLDPTKVDELESEVRPQSLQRLDENTAKWLGAFMKATEQGLGVTGYVYCELPILWVTDRKGDIWFAVEEIVRRDTREFAFPRLRNAVVGENYRRLGHPALLAAGPGRIGGEILFDVRASSPSWYITNHSGRYGLRSGRKPQHLTNARKKFQEFGIDLQEKFTPPRR